MGVQYYKTFLQRGASCPASSRRARIRRPQARASSPSGSSSSSARAAPTALVCSWLSRELSSPSQRAHSRAHQLRVHLPVVEIAVGDHAPAETPAADGPADICDVRPEQRLAASQHDREILRPLITGNGVKRGQKVAVIEAMKMENEILAAVDGTITAVHVNKGDSVLEGADIVTIG